MEFTSLTDIINGNGLRIVIVQGVPSPWSQSAKAMIEYKGLDVVIGAQLPGGANTELSAWAGTNSAPVVAWNDEPPVNRWDEILMLLERVAPRRPLVSAIGAERMQCLGMAHEIIGALGIGWNFRLDSFSRNLKHPAVAAMAPKYGYNDTDVAVANERIIQILNALAGQLRTQQAAGSEYFIGQTATAVDFYWTAVSWLLDMPPRARIPYHPDMAQWFGTRDQAVVDAIDPILLKHRDRMLSQFFKNPLEF